MPTDTGIRWHSATVVDTILIAERIRRITLRPDMPHKVRPGEHVKVLVTIDGRQVVRSYSIVDGAEDGSEYSLSVFQTPDSRGGSVFMHQLEAGDQISVTEPLQDFPLRVGAPAYVLVAGGIGITAIRHMASLLRRLGADYRIHYSARSPESMAYREELLEEHGDRLTTYFDSENRFLDIPGLISGLGTDTELYMCGPIRLMDAIRRAWAERELDPTNLRFETFGNSGWFQAEQFRVSIPRLGVSTDIGTDESLLEALEKLGVDMMSSCRRGECGLCQVDILNADARLDHRDVFFSDRQKKTSTKLCACVSRAASPTTDHRLTAPHITIDVP